MSIFDQDTVLKFSNFFKCSDKIYLTAGFREHEYELLIKYLDSLADKIVLEIDSSLENWMTENEEKTGTNKQFYKHKIEHSHDVFCSQTVAPPVQLHFKSESNNSILVDVIDGRNILIAILKFDC